jgi:NitT/TauT family transport system permease protein
MTDLKNLWNLSKNIFYNSLIWVLIILFWQVLAGLNLINTNFISSPSGIFSSFFKSGFWQVFGIDFAFSFNRIVVGFGLAFLSSYLLILVGLAFPKGLFLLSRIHSLIKYIPAPVLIPIAILLFGINEQTKIAVIFFTVLVLQLNHLLAIIQKDEQKYSILQKSWRINPIQRFKNFVFPISTFLYYRAIPGLVIWAFSIAIISEIILGGEAGLGVRIIQFQQIYNTDFLYAYLVLILILAFLSEFFLVNFFARFKWDRLKVVSGVVILASIIFSLSFNLYNYSPFENSDFKVLTYKATANLPLIVYQEKFNRDFNIELEFVGSGLQVMDTLLANKSYLGGYSDMPNVVSGIAKTNDLKLVSQVIEKPTHPNLFFVSKRGTVEDLSSLNDSKIGYYPNNLIIKQGLDFVLFTKSVRTSSVEYISSNDPNSLNQAYSSDKIDGLLTIEPYATDLEQRTGNKHLNAKETFVKGANFDSLPLAGLVVNQKEISSENLTKFRENLTKSLEFIRQNTDSDLKAIGELREIMQKNDINPDSQLSAYQIGTEINPKDLEILIKYAQNYQVEGLEKLNDIRVEDLYLK